MRDYIVKGETDLIFISVLENERDSTHSRNQREWFEERLYEHRYVDMEYIIDSLEDGKVLRLV